MENNCKRSRWQLLKAQLNNLSPEEFRAAIGQLSEGQLIDCRMPNEVEQGQLGGAVNIDFLAPDFWDQIRQLNKEQSYYVYCRSGRRSIRTCTLMQNGGFKKVYNLDGGLNAWQAVFGTSELPY